MNKRTLQTVFRVVKNRDNPYVQINKAVLEDTRLSFKAKGIMAYLLSRPDDWIVRHKDLVNRSTDGGRAVTSGLQELKKLGYVQEVVWRSNGRIAYRETLVFERPSDNPFPQELWGRQAHLNIEDWQELYLQNADKDPLYLRNEDKGSEDNGFEDNETADLTNKKNLPKVDSYLIRNLKNGTPSNYYVEDWKRFWDNALKGDDERERD